MESSRGDQHRYGQHYTPVRVARLLAALAIQSSSDVVLDPSCGDGRLLGESLRLKNHLSSKDEDLARQVFGIDRSKSAVRRAAETGARVARADFFDIEPGARLAGSVRLPKMFDAIIGNPPYIRQEVMGAADKRRIEKRLESDRVKNPKIVWPQWSGRSDIYVYFFARSIRFLKAGGRLVFLTSSSWLDVGYGHALREFLLKNFRILAVIESSAESFFSDASINTVITVVSREEDERARASNAVRFVRLSAPLAEAMDGPDELHKAEPDKTELDETVAFARLLENAQPSKIGDTNRVRLINQSDLMAASLVVAGGGWGKYLRADDVFFRIIERGNTRLKRLSHLARIRFGLKTGANDFFYVTGSGAKKGEAQDNSGSASLMRLGNIAYVRRGLTTGANEFFYLKAISDKDNSNGDRPGRAMKALIAVEDGAGARHQIESRYLSPIIFSLKEISGIMLDPAQATRLFFNCAAAKSRLTGTKALDYIREGERAGYNLRPTCAARNLWYSIARGMEPAPLIFPSKVGERWLVALNCAGIFEDKKLYGIFPLEKDMTLVLAALLNSTWARYYAEITCRQMTGAQAIADIDVAVAEQIMLPDPRDLSPAIRSNLESALATLSRRPVLSVFEEVKRADRRRLDKWALTAIGFTNRSERDRMLDQLYESVTELVRERLRK